MKVLIADDSALVRKNLRKALSAIPSVSEVVESHSLLSTLRQIQIDKPDFVVLDLQLPDGCGFQVLEHVRLQQDPPRVVVLSTCPSEHNRHRCLNLGAERFLDKSYAFQQLIAILDQAGA